MFKIKYIQTYKSRRHTFHYDSGVEKKAPRTLIR